MAENISASGANRFSVGRVLGTSFTIFLRNIVPFGAISAIIGIPYIILMALGVTSTARIEAAARGEEGSVPVGFFGMIAVFVIVVLLTTILSQSAINFGTFQDLRGTRPTLGACLSRGFATLPKVAGAGILASICFAFACMLLLVPGIILYIMWWVFVPAIVVEGAGITESFGRSRELTRGHRWEILGLLFIVGIIQWAFGLLLAGIAFVIGHDAGEILQTVSSLVLTAFTGVMTAVGYYYLRAEKEGIAIGDIASVFD